MVTFVFSIDAVLQCRFGISPLGEVFQAARAIGASPRDTPQYSWLKKREATLRDLHRRHDLTPLLVLVPERGYMPDFLTPPPGGPLADIGAELDRVRDTPGDVALAQIERSLEGREVDDAVRRALHSPDAPALLADLLEVLWVELLEPDWPRMRELLERDIAYRARRLAEGGLVRLFGDLSSNVALARSPASRPAAHDGDRGARGDRAPARPVRVHHAARRHDGRAPVADLSGPRDGGAPWGEASRSRGGVCRD